MARRSAAANVEPKAASPIEEVPAVDTPAVGTTPLATRIEAILIAADRPVSLQRLREALALDAESNDQLKTAIDELNNLYDQTERSFRVEAVAGGFRLMTRAAHAADVAAIRGLRDAQKLTRAGLETLAIIAYRQPATRAQIEAIRGVACGEVLKTLLEARLIAITGRAEELGRPMLYGTTRQFLETFGLASIRDLPPVDAAPDKIFTNLAVRTEDGENPDAAQASDPEPADQ